MTALRFTGDASSLEINLASWDGDAYVTVVVESHGFRGHNDLYILGDAFKAFCRGLLELQGSLRGEARLVAVSPEELEITFKPADALGHIRVSGRTGYHVQANHKADWHEVRFGFQIEPSALDSAVKVGWVREHAA